MLSSQHLRKGSRWIQKKQFLNKYCKMHVSTISSAKNNYLHGTKKLSTFAIILLLSSLLVSELLLSDLLHIVP